MNTRTRTLTAVLGLLLVGALLTVGGAAATDDVQVAQSEAVDTTQQGNLTFDSQATASSTITEEGPTSPGVVVEDVDTDVDSTVFVTYPEPELEAGDEVTIDLDNVGAQAWEVNGVSGDADSIDDVVVDGGNNPTIRFVEDVEYTFTDLPSNFHPLEFNNGSNSPLLSQDADGSFESDPGVGWQDNGNTVTFTVTPALSAELATYICTVHPSMEGAVQTTSEAQSNPVIAGLETPSAGTTGNVQIPVEEAGGAPGTHTAYLVPDSNLSGNYTPGDVLSNETVSNAIASEQATVFQSTLELQNQSVDGPIQEGDTLATLQTATLLDGVDNDTEFTVSVHPRRDLGTVASGEFVGSSDVVSGANTNVTVTADRVPEDGEFNEFPLTGANDLVAVVHLVNDSASVGDPSPPGEYPRLPQGSPSEFILYGVSNGGTVTTAEANGTVAFDNQATASSTFTGSEPSEPGVTVSAEANVESAVVVTYADESAGGTGLVVAGVETLAAGDGGNVVVPVEETGGFPGPHTAHLIPVNDLSGNYTAGDVVSNETAGNVLDSEQATVFQGTLAFENESVSQQVQEGDTLATVSVANLTGGDAAFTVDVHPVDEDGNLLGASYVGSSDVLTGENTDVPITAERAGQNVSENEFPLTGVNDLVAMIHVVEDNASAGDPASPGEYPPLSHVSALGPVPGGVTDAAVLRYPPVQDLTFPDQSLGVDGSVTVERVRSDGVESAVVVTYPGDGDLVIAGLTTGSYSNESVEVGVEDTGGFPGTHTAHILPVADLSGEYTPGDTVSGETASNILAQDTANISDDGLQGDIPLTVTVDPGRQYDENNVTFTADASGTSEDTDIQTLSVNFSAASGIDTAAITQSQVSVTAAGIGDPGVDSVQQNNPGELLITPQNSFTLDAVTGAVLVTVDRVVAPRTGEFTASLEFQDDSNQPAATGLANYSIDALSQSLTFETQSLDGSTVTVDGIQSSGVESAVVVTYAGSAGLVVAGLEIGTFDNESVEIAVEDAGGLQGPHTAHIVPTGGLSQTYQPGDLVSTETAANITAQETATVELDIGDNDPPTDTTGDGRLNDIDGDDEFTIFDVQEFFTNFETASVQTAPGLFNFDGTDPDDPTVTIFDVQSLFLDLAT